MRGSGFEAIGTTMLKRHKHEWEKVSEVTIPSFFERYDGAGRIPTAGNWMFERKHVVVMECKCGKIKRLIKAFS